MNIYYAIKGLTELMTLNNYAQTTIHTYVRVWKKLAAYMIEKFGTEEFSIEYGLQFLEDKYQFSTRFDNKNLKQREVQLLRNINMIQDYKLYGVLTRRYYSKEAKFELNSNYKSCYDSYLQFITNSSFSKSTQNHYIKISLHFLDFLQQKNIILSNLMMKNINDYIISLSGYSFKKIELELCGIRNLIRFLYNNGVIAEDISILIHMPKMSKQAKVPSAWTIEEIKSILAVIDRNSPIGKRDYAMIILATLTGMRISDIRKLKFKDIDWRKNTISFIQSKTGNPITNPLNKKVGLAIIDYIKNARPKFYDTEYIFIKHMPPFDIFSENDHLSHIIRNYALKAGLDLKKHKAGFHSLRHTAATLLLENGVNLPVISGLLGHSSIDITAVYLKNDLEKLRECVLDLDEGEIA